MDSALVEGARSRTGAARTVARSRRARTTVAMLAGSAALVSGLAVSAAPSGAIVAGPNGLIAFESNRDGGDNDIFVMNPDGSRQRNLTANMHGAEVDPSWSPDGQRIAFTSNAAQRSNPDVYVMDANGDNVVRLTDAPGEDRGTSWTTDGKIVFHSSRNASASHTFDTFIMEADGSNQTLIEENASAAYACGSSTDGIITFNSNRDGDFDIYTKDLTGPPYAAPAVNVTNTRRFESGPVFAPDCQQIAFNSTDQGGSLDIFRIDVDGTDRTNLTNAPGIFDAFSAWSPDGTQIAFASVRVTEGSPEGDFELYKMSAVDGSNVVQLTDNPFGHSDLRPDWGIHPPLPTPGG